LTGSRSVLAVLSLCGIALLSSCGSEPPAPGNLTVTSTPAGAAITLDGRATGHVTPYTFEDLEGDNTYVVQVELEDYLPASEQLSLSYGAHRRLDFPLTSMFGDLIVTSEPAGADISLDGEATGEVTPHTFAVLAGEHTVSVSSEGYNVFPAERLIQVDNGGEFTASFTLSQESGQLLVTSDPAGATILLDGDATGEITPFTFTLPPATYSVTVELPGHAVDPVAREVIVVDGEQATADFTLSSGELVVTSTPAGATILVDDVSTGEVTPATLTLPPGAHTVSVQLAGHVSDPGAVEVTITDGGSETADFSLTAVDLARITLMEGFSNVECDGCPEFNANVEYLLGQPGNGPDRVLFVKWAGPVPTPLDPFYLDATAIIEARLLHYTSDGNLNHPTLFIDGVLAGTPGGPPSVATMQEIVDASGDVAVTFAVEVAADLSALTVPATVTVMVPDAVDLTGTSLEVVLTYTEVETAIEFQGISVYHNVIRDHETANGDLGPLTAGLHEFPVTLHDPDPEASGYGHPFVVHGKAVVAFVQRTSDKHVIQAGSTLTAAPIPATATVRNTRPEPRPGASLGGQ